MRTTFRLKRPNADRESVVYVDILHNGNRSKFYTPISVPPKYWNIRQGRLKIPQPIKDGEPILADMEAALNSRLDGVKSKIMAYSTHCIKNDTPESAAGLKSYLDSMLSSGTDVNSYTFLTDYFEHFYLPGCTSGTITFLKNNQYLRYSPGTIKSKNGSLEVLKAFEKARYRIRFDRVDMEFYNAFLKWSESTGHKINQTGKVIKEIKSIMRYSYEQGVHNNTTWDNRKFSVLREEVTTVALTKKELDKLQELKLTGRTKHYRDVFLVGCYTALRISDYKRITPDHIKQRDGYYALEITTQKTKAPVIIPIAKEILPILMNPEFFGRTVIEQKLNKTIKDLCEAAGMTQMIEVVRNTQGRQSITKIEKYKLVSSHTARRTGATYLYNLHGRTLDVMQITGHRTERAFLKYIKISPEEAAGRIATNLIK